MLWLLGALVGLGRASHVSEGQVGALVVLVGSSGGALGAHEAERMAALLSGAPAQTRVGSLLLQVDVEKRVIGLACFIAGGVFEAVRHHRAALRLEL